MSRSDDENLPEKLKSQLHGMIPSLPQATASRDAELLRQARIPLTKPGANWAARAPRWVAAAAAVLLLGVGIISYTNRSSEPAQLAAATARPTIVDALRAAKRPGTSQAEVDRLALAAVRLNPEALQ